MNERIKELWNKAAESTAAFPSGQNTSWETQVNFMDKFAELIVKECCHALWTDECHTSDLAVEEFNRNSRKIKRHFGVE